MARPESQAIAGYFPTPDHLVPAIASLVALERERYDRPVFFDPCAGTGSALVALAAAVLDLAPAEAAPLLPGDRARSDPRRGPEPAPAARRRPERRRADLWHRCEPRGVRPLSQSTVRHRPRAPATRATLSRALHRRARPGRGAPLRRSPHRARGIGRASRLALHQCPSLAIPGSRLRCLQAGRRRGRASGRAGPAGSHDSPETPRRGRDRERTPGASGRRGVTRSHRAPAACASHSPRAGARRRRPALTRPAIRAERRSDGLRSRGPPAPGVAASGRAAAAPRAHRARARRGAPQRSPARTERLELVALPPGQGHVHPHSPDRRPAAQQEGGGDRRGLRAAAPSRPPHPPAGHPDVPPAGAGDRAFRGTVPRRVQHRRPPRALQRVARAARPRAAPGDARSRRPRTPDRAAQPRPPSVPAAGGADPGGSQAPRSRREPSAPGRGRHREVDRGAFDRRCPRAQPLRRDERGARASRHHPTWPPSCVQDAGRLPTAPAPELDRSGTRRSSGCARADRSGALGPRPAGRDLRLEPRDRQARIEHRRRGRHALPRLWPPAAGRKPRELRRATPPLSGRGGRALESVRAPGARPGPRPAALAIGLPSRAALAVPGSSPRRAPASASALPPGFAD